MIWLFNFKSRAVGSYKTFEEVCDHFRRVEHLKPVAEGEPYGNDRWDFVYWPHKRLSSLHEHLKDTHFSEAERDAYEGEFDLIEIFDGRSEFADQYIVTPDLNVSDLMREWCFDYAYANGCTVLETHSTKLPNTHASAVSTTLRGFGFEGLQEPFREGVQP
jgi:hypothetical protein